MLADRLRYGDEIRVVAPSGSLSTVLKGHFQNACDFLKEKGYRVTFSDHVMELNGASTSSVASRVEDLHRAFLDDKVKMVLAAHGGFHVNQILEYLDYSILAAHPKILCGYSDITALLHAVYARTGLVTYHGPGFSYLGRPQGREYTDRMFEACLMGTGPYPMVSSEEAGGCQVIREGACEGRILGGNLCTLNLLQGTKYMPELSDVVLFIEDDNIMGEYFAAELERNLQSLLQAAGGRILGLVFGRFEESCGMNAEVAGRIVAEKKQLKGVPVLFGADFGHVFPSATFPVGGKVKISASGGRAEILIVEH